MIETGNLRAPLSQELCVNYSLQLDVEHSDGDSQSYQSVFKKSNAEAFELSDGYSKILVLDTSYEINGYETGGSSVTLRNREAPPPAIAELYQPSIYDYPLYIHESYVPKGLTVSLWGDCVPTRPDDDAGPYQIVKPENRPYILLCGSDRAGDRPFVLSPKAARWMVIAGVVAIVSGIIYFSN